MYICKKILLFSLTVLLCWSSFGSKNSAYGVDVNLFEVIKLDVKRDEEKWVEYGTGMASADHQIITSLQGDIKEHEFEASLKISPPGAEVLEWLKLFGIELGYKFTVETIRLTGTQVELQKGETVTFFYKPVYADFAFVPVDKNGASIPQKSMETGTGVTFQYGWIIHDKNGKVIENSMTGEIMRETAESPQTSTVAQITPITTPIVIYLTPEPTADTPVLPEREIRGWNGSGYQYLMFGASSSGGGMKEPILWRVLYVADQKALLLSEYILEARQYDDTNSDWAQSKIKKWLNATFLKESFTTRQEMNSLVSDKELGTVFLLSKADYLNTSYGFSNNENYYDALRSAKPAYNANNSGIWLSEEGYCTYFTRTGKGSTSLWQIRADGTFGEARIDRKNIGIRPAIIISLDEIQFNSGIGTVESPFRQ